MTPRRLRVLHLAFEDPRRPGSGGGAVRTREINARLADRHEIEVVTAGWPGARPRTEDGVSWRHTPALSGRGSSLPYFALAPLLAASARRHRFDLVVEDFAAPVSTIGLPRATGLPVVGVVQWFFAEEKAHQYHLPFDRVQAWGLAAHSTLVAVSDGLADQLRASAPHADVHVVENGVHGAGGPAPTGTERSGGRLLFLGRLEVAQKGVDVLLRALAEPPLRDRADLSLHLAGDGPDERALRGLAETLGVAHRLRWLGRVSGGEKASVLAGSTVLVVPSRYETFGMVAAEGMAAGIPIVASDVPCLRDVVSGGGGVLVPSSDPVQLAGALADLLDDAPRRTRMASDGIAAVGRYDWDRLARAQEQVYLDVVERHRGGRR